MNLRSLDAVCLNIVDCEHKTAPIDESGSHFAVGTPAMRGNAINYAEARRISASTFELWTRRLRPRAGDLLLAREAPVGPVVEMPPAEDVAPGQRTVLLRPNPMVVNSRYLYFYLSSPQQQALLAAKAEGSTVPHLNVADVRTFAIRLPTLPEQEAIAEVLGALDDKIAANTALACTADDLAAVESQSLQLLAGVDVVLGDVMRLEYGRALPATRRVSGGVEVYGSGGVTGAHNEALVDRPGVVVGRKGTVGAVYWASGPHFPIDTTYFVVSNANVATDVYSYFLLKSLPLSDMNSDSAVPGLNRAEVHAIRVRLPDRPAISAFSKRALMLFDVKDRCAQENRVLAATRDALLPALMSGRLRVKDAEAVVESVL